MTRVRELTVLPLGRVRDNGIPVPGFLLRLDDGRRVLVDTGCPAEMIDDPRAPFAVSAEDHVLGRLAALGLGPADISLVVITHFDPDHCGGNDAFPDAEFVVQRAQYEHARSSGLHRYEWLRPHWDDPRLRYRLADGDTVLMPGLALIESGGHVPGHQSVLAELPGTGAVLLAGDAWARGTDAATRPLSPFDHDAGAVRASQRKLASLAASEDIRLVVHNHDAGQWETLRLAPDSYR